MSNKLKWKHPESIVDCEWLRRHNDDQNLRIFDCTTFLHFTDHDPLKPYDVESGFLNYQAAHIPKASFLDLQEDLSDINSEFKFTLPKLKELGEKFQNKGVGEPYHIILYSANGLHWAARVWWMIFSVGYQNVSILDGGFQEWQRLKCPIEKGHNRFEPSKFKLRINHQIFIGKDEVLSALYDDKYHLINSLTADIHSGNNPRYGRLGRIPSSVNIPFLDLLDSRTGKLKSPDDLRKIYRKNYIRPESQIISYCGGGIAASLDAFVLRQLGFKNLQIYDNSLSEWAMDEKLPIEV